MSPNSNETFRHFMRRAGINIFSLAIFTITWIIYSNLVLTAPHFSSLVDLQNFATPVRSLFECVLQELGIYQLSSSAIEKYGYIPTLWLLTTRTQTLFCLPQTIVQAITLLKSEPPNIDEDIVDDGEEVRRSSIRKKTNREAGQPVHCICVRIVTRGDANARPLLQKAVTAAIALLSEMCRCEKLKAHVVTQTQFLDETSIREWRDLGATEVKEIVVPPDYKTPKGSLYKARNLCYWQERGGVGSDCDETRSWILSLDEEAVITRSFVTAFINDLLRRDDTDPEIGYALSPATMDVNSTLVAFLTKMLEARFVAHHYAILRNHSGGTEGTMCFHGGAYMARASTDRHVGIDCGPVASVAEDFALGVSANEKKIKFRYLDAWFVEGTPPTLSGYIQRAARIIRGQSYGIYHLPMSRQQRNQQFWRLIVLVAHPFLNLFMLSIFLFSLPSFLPAGPRCFFLDTLFIFGMSVQAFAYVFGATYMRMSKGEIIAAVILSPFMVYVIAPIIDASIALAAFWSMVVDWKTGSVGFVVTDKVA